MRESPETTEFLGRFLLTFGVAETDDIARINTRLLVGVLGELIDRRRNDADRNTLELADLVGEGDPVVIAGARFKVGLGEFAAALRERNGTGSIAVDVGIVKIIGAINALVDDVVRACRGKLPQRATPPDDGQPGLSDQEEEAIDGSRGTGSAED